MLGAIVTLSFYRVQNAPGSAGGDVAVVKVLWLFCVIVFWYILPAIWLFDVSLSRKARLACMVLLASMVFRAFVELVMMYVFDSWKHSYGIGHDVASIVLCGALVIAMRRDEVWLSSFFAYCAILFVFETYFALYLRRVSNADGSVFFLPPSDAHAQVLQMTTVVVTVSVIIGVYIVWKWSNAESARRNSNG